MATKEQMLDEATDAIINLMMWFKSDEPREKIKPKVKAKLKVFLIKVKDYIQGG